MRTFCIAALLTVALFGNKVAAQQGEVSKPNTPATMSTFLVIYKPGPGWVAGKPLAEQPLQEHGRYILSLFSNGKVKTGGPFKDGTGGAAVLYATNEAEAKGMVMKDPAVVTGVFVYELHPWGLVDFESYLKMKSQTPQQ